MLQDAAVCILCNSYRRRGGEIKHRRSTTAFWQQFVVVESECLSWLLMVACSEALARCDCHSCWLRPAVVSAHTACMALDAEARRHVAAAELSSSWKGLVAAQVLATASVVDDDDFPRHQHAKMAEEEVVVVVAPVGLLGREVHGRGCLQPPHMPLLMQQTEALGSFVAFPCANVTFDSW